MPGDALGRSYRQAWEDQAAIGSQLAARKLVGPPMPDELAYLYAWLVAVHGRSGVGMSGLAPLSYSTIDSWSGLMDVAIAPHEIDALLTLDAVLLSAASADDEKPGGSDGAKQRAEHTSRAERLARGKRE